MTVRPGAGAAAETPEDRRQRANALAALFAAGGTVSSLVLLSTAVWTMPGWQDVHQSGILVTVVFALSTALGLRLRGSQVGPRLCATLTAGGTVLIGACQGLAGGGMASSAYALLYVWVVLHAAMYFSARAVAGHVVLTVVVQGVAFASVGEAGALAPQFVLTAGTQVAAALVIGSLARRLRGLADTDALTGLGNRRVVDRVLRYEFDRARRMPVGPLAVAVLDLDGFKAFNDAHGHQAGDRLLVDVARRWLPLLRVADTLSRTGGDEFTLLLPASDPRSAAAVVQRLVEVVPAGLGCSAGMAVWDGRETAADLLGRADEALYVAKGRTDALVVEAVDLDNLGIVAPDRSAAGEGPTTAGRA